MGPPFFSELGRLTIDHDGSLHLYLGRKGWRRLHPDDVPRRLAAEAEFLLDLWRSADDRAGWRAEVLATYFRGLGLA